MRKRRTTRAITPEIEDEEEEGGGRRYTKEEKGKGRAEPLVLGSPQMPSQATILSGADEGYGGEEVFQPMRDKGKGRAAQNGAPAVAEAVQLQRADVSAMHRLAVGWSGEAWRAPSGDEANVGLGLGLGAELQTISPTPSFASGHSGRSAGSGKRSRRYDAMDADQLEAAEIYTVQRISQFDVKLQAIRQSSRRQGSSSSPDGMQSEQVERLLNSIERVRQSHLSSASNVV